MKGHVVFCLLLLCYLIFSETKETMAQQQWMSPHQSCNEFYNDSLRGEGYVIIRKGKVKGLEISAGTRVGYNDMYFGSDFNSNDRSRSSSISAGYESPNASTGVVIPFKNGKMNPIAAIASFFDEKTGANFKFLHQHGNTLMGYEFGKPRFPLRK